MFDFLKNLFGKKKTDERYASHPEAVIISCFFNPQNSPYRLLAFQKWYRSIKHLNHRIIECLVGEKTKPQLPDKPYISRVWTESLLWHKETLLNKIIRGLPNNYKYIFWVDADVIFQNQNWLVDGVKALQTANIIQPFEYCIHLDKGEVKPDFDVEFVRQKINANYKILSPAEMWRSFCSNYSSGLSNNADYDRHGHVGFAWGANRFALEKVWLNGEPMPLYDKALIGGADHILAHAAAGQIPHSCIQKSFTDNLDEVTEWSQSFYKAMDGKIGFVKGDLYHLWHGDIAKREYLKRIQDFTSETRKLVQRDKNGLWMMPTPKAASYMSNYYRRREVVKIEDDFDGFDDGFYEDMGYRIYDIISMFGDPYYGPESENVEAIDATQEKCTDFLNDIPGETVESPVPAEVTSESQNFS